MKTNQRTAIIVDIDNTLFDWLKMWHSAFSAMLEGLVELSGVPRETLIQEFRSVHQRQGTVEYSFAIEELPSIRERFPNVDLSRQFQPAIDAYRIARRKHLVLYPRVVDTLRSLRGAGIAIAAYTESQAFLARRRVQWLELDGLIDILYSTPDHEIPDWINLRDVRRYSDEHYELKKTRHVVLEKGEHKPSPDVLNRIVDDLRVSKDRALYVGDSLHHDIWMAQQAGVADAWAEYGVLPGRSEYDLLVAVTHWDNRRVAIEKSLRAIEVIPTHILGDDFAQVLTLPTLSEALKSQLGLRRKLG